MVGVLDSMNYIQQQGDKGRALGKQNRLASLSSQAYGAKGPEQAALVQQAIGTDPAAGMALGDKLQTRERDEVARAGNVAKYMREALESKDPAKIQGAYRATMPYWQEHAGGRPLPPSPDDTMLPMLYQLEAAAAGSTNANGLPAGLQEFNAMSKGLSAEDNLKARRVALGLDGRASTSGYTQVKFTDGQGRERVGSFNGRTGSIDLPDGTSFNPQTGQTSQTQPEQGNGFQVIDVGNGEPPIDPRAVQAAAMNPGGDFIMGANGPVNSATGQPPPQGQPQGYPQQRAPQTGGDQFTSRSAEDQAGRTAGAQAQAKIDAEMGSYNRMTDLEVDRTRQVEDAKADVKLTAERNEQAPKKIAQYKQALAAAANVGISVDKALGLAGRMSTGFIGARSRGIEGSPAFNLKAEIETVRANLGFDRLQQMRDNSPTGGALGQVAVQELIALQSTVANLDPDQSEEQLRDNLGRIKTHYSNWVAAVNQGLQQEQSGGGQAPAASPSAPGTVWRRVNGKLVRGN